MPTLSILASLPFFLPAPGTGSDAALVAPRIAETRVYQIRQTVSLNDVPADAKQVRLWVPLPTDGAWQHVLDRRVVSAPEGWQFVKQPESNGEVVFAQTKAQSKIEVVVETTVVRQSPVFDLGGATVGEVQPELFTDELAKDAPLMTADAEMQQLASKACSSEKDPRKKVVKLLDAVADVADHYSKDKTKPSCGRGAAEDCMKNGGGCCTDLHSLFIAVARAQGIPARMQYGYRLKADKEGTDYDPSYRCWVEYFLPNAGWVPTDIVVADSGEASARAAQYGTLDARRVWLWQGRDLELVPKQNGDPIQTMSCGWAEIDGKPVDVLPAADGTPSKLRRSIHFKDLTPKDAGQ
jgi:hypothetical protein